MMMLLCFICVIRCLIIRQWVIITDICSCCPSRPGDSRPPSRSGPRWAPRGRPPWCPCPCPRKCLLCRFYPSVLLSHESGPRTQYWNRSWPKSTLIYGRKDLKSFSHGSTGGGCHGRCSLAARAATTEPWRWSRSGQWFRDSKCRGASHSKMLNSDDKKLRQCRNDQTHGRTWAQWTWGRHRWPGCWGTPPGGWPSLRRRWAACTCGEACGSADKMII